MTKPVPPNLNDAGPQLGCLILSCDGCRSGPLRSFLHLGHCTVRNGEKRVEIVPVAGVVCDPDTGRDFSVLQFFDRRPPKLIPQPLDQLGQAGRRRDIGQHHDKLVPAHASDKIVRPHAAA